jgi:hypothetical protein
VSNLAVRASRPGGGVPGGEAGMSMLGTDGRVRSRRRVRVAVYGDRGGSEADEEWLLRNWGRAGSSERKERSTSACASASDGRGGPRAGPRTGPESVTGKDPDRFGPVDVASGGCAAADGEVMSAASVTQVSDRGFSLVCLREIYRPYFDFGIQKAGMLFRGPAT